MSRIFSLRALARAYIAWCRERDEARTAADARAKAAELTESDHAAIRAALGVSTAAPYYLGSG